MQSLTCWYALQTRSNLEKSVVNELDSKGIPTFCPSFSESHQWADRKKTIERPVFPGYVFTRFCDPSPVKLRVLQTNGVVRILGMGKLIEPIPDEQIESIRRMLTSGKVCFPHPFLQEGSRVRVKRGPLKDIEGTLVRIKQQTRLVLSVDLISHSVATEVDMADVEVVASRNRSITSICA